MTKKIYGVIGLGKFGYYVADGLIRQGEKVIIADKDEAPIKELSNIANTAYILDSTDVEALKEAGFKDLDFVIVSIGENIESSILTLMALKEIGVRNIIVKAITPIHGKILQKLGASRVVYPEKEASQHLLRSFIAHPDYECIDVLDSLKIVILKVIENFVGKNANEILSLVITKKDSIDLVKVIAIKNSDNTEWSFNPDLEETLYENGEIIIFGPNALLEKLSL